MTVPVSIIIMTKNEEVVIGRCLAALRDFDDIHVADSASSDRTVFLAEQAGAKITSFHWNGRYPKKKQWCLENLPLKHDWVLYLDADEEISPALVEEIMLLFGTARPRRYAGFFIKGRNVINGRVLRFGQCNHKLSLLNRHKMAYPEVDDLDIQGGNEVEGHYQPVLLPGALQGTMIGRLHQAVWHHIYESGEDWTQRHARYALWERGMNKKQAWPPDPVAWRQKAKIFLRRTALRPYLIFIYGYILKGGFLDGPAGFDYARGRFHYYRLIADPEKRPRSPQ